MFTYEYLRPSSIWQACEMLAAHEDAAVIAGGTDFLVQIRAEDEKWAKLRYVVDLTHIRGLDSVSEEGGVIKIGALASHARVANSPLLRKEAAFLCHACGSVGSPQIRNRGTIGGNIGNASPAADPVTPLIALNAEIVAVSARGERVMPLSSIYLKPYRTNLEKDEIITEIRFKALPAGTRTAFVKLGRRKALAVSRMNAAVALIMDGDMKVTAARVCAGSVFPAPERVPEAEALIRGEVTEDMAEAAGIKVSEAMIAITGIRWSSEYKRPVAVSLVKRAISQAAGYKE